MDSASDDIGRISVREHQPLSIDLSGEFDTSNVAPLQTLLEGPILPGDVVVSAGEVTFASAALLNCLIAASTRLTASGHELRISPCSALLMRLLMITATTDLVRLAA